MTINTNRESSCGKGGKGEMGGDRYTVKMNIGKLRTVCRGIVGN